MSLRRLTMVVVETGNCRRAPGLHGVDGICSPQSSTAKIDPDVARPCYAGVKDFAYVDLDSPRDMGVLATVLT